MWSAWTHAASLPYRGAQLDELLQLLEENDYENLRHARAEHVKGPMTWARLAGLAVDRIRRPLLRGERDAEDDAETLEQRLAARDASTSSRVTGELRARIEQLVRVGKGVHATRELAEGATPTEELVGLMLGLRQRWFALRGDEAVDKKWLVDLVSQAAARVLQSNAHGALKGLAGRAVTQWAPPAPPAPAASLKRPRLGEEGGGEKVTWDSDDDF